MRLLLCLCCLLPVLTARCQQYFLFAGTYTHTGSKGIYVYRFNAATGALDSVSCTDNVVNPSYLAIAPGGNYLYACTETKTINAGSISVFSFNRHTGRLTFINKQPSGGDNPVYVAVHRSGKWAVMGNYTGGSLSVFPIHPDGSVAPLSQNIVYQGKSVDAARQDKPHVHSVNFSPDQHYLFVPDLGTDKVMIYHFDEQAQQPLQPASQPYVVTMPGSGPRHMAFHPNKRFAYLVEEMAGAVVAYRYNAANGNLDSLQRIFTHRAGAGGPFRSADIHVSPDGRFLYVSNREAEKNIAIFSIDPASGKLTSIGYEPTLGTEPRNFIIEPSGKYLLVANQESNNIVVFKRNARTGLLHPTGVQASLPLPACLQMLLVKDE